MDVLSPSLRKFIQSKVFNKNIELLRGNIMWEKPDVPKPIGAIKNTINKHSFPNDPDTKVSDDTVNLYKELVDKSREELLDTINAKGNEIMEFETIKEELRKRVPGTTSIYLELNSEDVYLSITYKTLGITVKIHYCEDLDILCYNYIKTLVVRINNQIEYHKGSVTSLEYFIQRLKATIQDEKRSKS